MTDAQGRIIDYMRISITDRCNLRCKYCMPDDLPSVCHHSILRYEEILRICAAAVGLGIRNFRVTGGEPLVRRGFLDFLKTLKQLPGAESVSITTNGVLLEPYLDDLAAMGLDGINISLDTLNPHTYRELTGTDALDAVLSSVHKAVVANLRVKLNCVPLLGINDRELPEIAALAQTLPVDVRFIELMPTEAGRPFRPVPGERVRNILRERYPDLRPVTEWRGSGPARYEQSDSLLGRIGYIDALTGHFCRACNRIRLTGEGFLKLCLYHDAGISLRELVRSGATVEELQQVMAAAIGSKPEHHYFGDAGMQGGIGNMSRIGG